MIHKLSDVQTVNIGKETSIWQFSVVLKNAIIGSNTNIAAHCFIENDVIIGNNVTVKCGVYLWDGIRIEDNVFIGPNVTFTNDKIPRSKNKLFNLLSTKVKEGATIGAGTIVLPGIEIGRYSFVSAGSVLTKSVGDFELWQGNPAKHIGYITKAGVILDKSKKGKEGNVYKFVNDDFLLV